MVVHCAAVAAAKQRREVADRGYDADPDQGACDMNRAHGPTSTDMQSENAEGARVGSP